MSAPSRTCCIAFSILAAFALVAFANAATHSVHTVLHDFQGGTDGGMPYATMISDAAGNLYGTAVFGNDIYNGHGSIFKVDAAGNESTLYSFTGGVDGDLPYGGL